MSPASTAFLGAKIHDGARLFDQHALLAEADGTLQVVARGDIPQGTAVKTLEGGIICPGFVDLQVNGGGGVMFNDDQSVSALRIIASAHARLGTVAILPTLITDTADVTKAALDAVEDALAQGVPGIAGIHLEGPHLSVARKGAHDADLIRPMDDADLDVLLGAARRIPNIMVTVAPENTRNHQITAMAEAGIIVSLGHTDADFDTCLAAFDAGAGCATHLFNAMSQMGNRAPGLVGAILSRGDIYAGLIADGVHVHPDMIRIALAAKRVPSRIFLVTDAMATAGSAIDGFSLNGRDVMRCNNRLTLADGTLAGADLSMARAISVMTEAAGDPLEAAIARATALPARLLRTPGGLGRLSGGLDRMILLDPGNPVRFLKEVA
ncbi:MAG: N-acetylglucosamine-6-phosphate deacetylase [Pseudomonadota bacterium]